MLKVATFFQESVLGGSHQSDVLFVIVASVDIGSRFVDSLRESSTVGPNNRGRRDQELKQWRSNRQPVRSTWCPMSQFAGRTHELVP